MTTRLVAIRSARIATLLCSRAWKTMANFIPDPKACAATLAAWSNAIAAINAYCTSVRALTMPAASALSRVDSSVFNDLSQHVDQAHLVGGIWLVSVKAASNAAPSAFTDANSVVSLFFTNANTAATALLQNRPTRRRWQLWKAPSLLPKTTSRESLPTSKRPRPLSNAGRPP